MAVVPATALAQDTLTVSGTVQDAATGQPLQGISVSIEGVVSSTSDAAGAFRLPGVPAGPHVVRFTGFGYVDKQVEWSSDTATPWQVELEPEPFRIPGIRVRERSFRARWDSVTMLLDDRLDATQWSKPPRVASTERLRLLDDKEDPEVRLAAALKLHPLLDYNCSFRYFGNRIQPRIFIDGEDQGVIGCDRFGELAPTEVCRIELVGSSVRVYTCRFLASVAAGKESVPRLLDVVLPDWW